MIVVMTQQSAAIARPAPTTRSRVTNNAGHLPGVSLGSTWGRLYKDQVQDLCAHLGGIDRISTPQMSLCRRAATFECELVQLESKIGSARERGEDVADSVLDLYQRLTNSQRRVLEAIGLTRQAFDTVPTLDSYVSGKAKPTK